MTDREKLIELITESGACFNCFPVGNFDEYQKQKITDYLLENGVIVSPCKVGDTVYWLDNEKVKQGEVFEISVHSDGILVHTDIQFCLEVENVSLTREEAEKALAERQDKNEKP